MLGIFSDSAEAKCDESANEAQSFITQLDSVVERVAREQAAAPARAADAAAEGQAVQPPPPPRALRPTPKPPAPRA